MNRTFLLFEAVALERAISFDPMIHAAPDLEKIVFLNGCGHWTQQERPVEVNSEIIAFLRAV